MRRDLLIVLALAALWAAGCSEPERCIRESHCMSGFTCISGHCVMPEAGMDGGDVMVDADAMTLDAEAGMMDAAVDAAVDADAMPPMTDGAPDSTMGMPDAAPDADAMPPMTDGGTPDA